MKNLTLMLAAGAVGALAVSAATRTEAGALSGAEGNRIAIDDVSAIESVRYGRVYRGGVGVGRVYRAPVRRAVAYGAAATGAAYSSYNPYSYGYSRGYSSYGYAPGYSSYGYGPGYSSYGYAPDINSHLGDGVGIGIQRAGGYSDSAFGFGPTGSISDGR
jgi:hypothetical protein